MDISISQAGKTVTLCRERPPTPEEKKKDPEATDAAETINVTFYDDGTPPRVVVNVVLVTDE